MEYGICMEYVWNMYGIYTVYIYIWNIWIYPLVICYSLLLKMTIEIVDLPIKHGDVPWLC